MTRRTIAAVVAATVLTAGLAMPARAVTSVSMPATVSEGPSGTIPDPGPSAPVARSVEHPAETAEFPEPGTTAVVVAEPSQGEAVENGSIVSVRAIDAKAAGEPLTVTVLDRAATEAAYVQGVAFEIDAEATAVGRVEITLDYSAFRHAYGGGWDARLRLVRLTDCDPEATKQCPAPVPVESVNDFSSATVTAIVDLASLNAEPTKDAADADSPASADADATSEPTTTTTAEPDDRDPTPAGEAGAEGLANHPDTPSSSTTTTAPSGEAAESGPAAAAPNAALAPAGGGSGGSFALMAGASGGTGDYTATPLLSSARWNVGMGSGGFSWSYPVPLMAGPAGEAPSVELDYSSQSVDGRTAAENSQASPSGLGWDLGAGGFIERSYKSCADDGGTIADFCWSIDNASIVLNGQATELVKGSGSDWRLKDDPRWRVRKITTWTGNGDNDGEGWEVITPDGTQYLFGRGIESPANQIATNSVWSVPVYGNHTGEPCHASPGWCQQAWRWNLDRITDPHGNVTSFFYQRETNYYGRGGAPGNVTQYTRAGWLERIEYGQRSGSEGATAPTQVLFTVDNRCEQMSSCPTPVSTNPDSYPDVPTDLMCPGVYCPTLSPTFFTTKRLTDITAQSWNSTAGAFRNIDKIVLTHEMVDNTEDFKYLWLRSVQRLAYGGGTSSDTLPVVRFDSDGQLLANRFDTGGGTLPAMYHHRVGQITDEYANRIHIDYGQPDPCVMPPPGQGLGDSNDNDCFPQWVNPDVGASAWGIFNKYLTTQVRVEPLEGGSPEMETNYTYEDDAAWHHNATPMLPTTLQTWNEWRGYSKVLVDSGTSAFLENHIRNRFRIYRGMDGDKLFGGATRVATVQAFDGTNYTDSNWLRGRTLDERALRGDGFEFAGTLHEYTTTITAGSGADAARRTLETTTTHRSRDTITTPVVTTRTRVLPDTSGRPAKVIEDGDLLVAGDERCTDTTYAEDAANWKLDYPASVILRKLLSNGTCGPGSVYERATRFYFDGSTTLNALPGAGDVTRTDGIADATWNVYAKAHYDAYGRADWNEDHDANRTTTAYFPSVGLPTQIITTNPAPFLHQTITALTAARSQPTSVTDPNGKVTTLQYDVFGRLTNVRYPADQDLAAGGTWSRTITYEVSAAKAFPPRVVTSDLQSATPTATYLESAVYYDSALRPRETQVTSPTGGSMIISGVRYDERGQTSSTYQPYAVTGAPGAEEDPVLPAVGTPVLDQVTTYDELSRPKQIVDDIPGTNPVTTIGYTTFIQTTTPPVGGQVRTKTDVFGRQIAVAEHNGTGWDEATYGFDMADQLLTIKDPSNNQITYAYDKTGNRIDMLDPDAGHWTYEYDFNGNQTSVTDSALRKLFTSYDALNRPVSRQPNTDPETAHWYYDATGEKGLLDRAVRTQTGTMGGTYTADVAGYDANQRPQGRTYTVAGTGTGFDGTYPIGYHYDRAGRQDQVSYSPGTGGGSVLAAETVTTGFDSVGAPTQLNGIAAYVSGTTRDPDGRILTRTLGAASDNNRVVRTYGYDTRLRLTGWQATRPGLGGPAIQDDLITLDAIGNVLTRNDSRTTIEGQSTPNGQSECYGYDTRNRLTSAYTTSAATCPASPSFTTAPTGPSPYMQRFNYTADGRINTRVEGADPTAVTNTYTYPTQGTGTRPHAVNNVTGATGGDCDAGTTGTQTYCYDSNGNLTNRPGSTATRQILTWDDEHRLAQVDDNGTGTPGAETDFVYDTDGARLIRKTPTNTTLYIEGHELTLTGSTLTTKRYYTLGDVVVGVRDSATTALTYLLGDQLGSTTVSVNSSTGAVAMQRYLPYGAIRSSTGTQATEKGWIGQTKDSSTGLQYLNARYYDPVIGRFTATDPLADLARPGSLDAYGYALDSPIGSKDPSGLGCLLMNGRPCSSATSGGGGGGDSTGGGSSGASGPPTTREAHLADVPDPTRPLGYMTGPDPLDTFFGAFEAAARFGFDWEQCGDTVSWGCGLQVAGIAPWGKLGKFGKLGKLLRFGDNLDEAAIGRNALMRELGETGIKHTAGDILRIAKDPTGRIVFLESGNARSGLLHIVREHSAQFAQRGVPESAIPDLVMDAVTKGTIVGYQGAGVGRPIYDVAFNGATQRVAVTTSSNGFIVGANPA